jgi:hypothetical protein
MDVVMTGDISTLTKNLYIIGNRQNYSTVRDEFVEAIRMSLVSCNNFINNQKLTGKILYKQNKTI